MIQTWIQVLRKRTYVLDRPQIAHRLHCNVDTLRWIGYASNRIVIHANIMVPAILKRRKGLKEIQPETSDRRILRTETRRCVGFMQIVLQLGTHVACNYNAAELVQIFRYLSPWSFPLADQISEWYRKWERRRDPGKESEVDLLIHHNNNLP